MQSALPNRHRPASGWVIVIALGLSALLHLTLLIGGGVTPVRPFTPPAPERMIRVVLNPVTLPPAPIPHAQEPATGGDKRSAFPHPIPRPQKPAFTAPLTAAPQHHADSAVRAAPTPPSAAEPAHPALSLQRLLTQVSELEPATDEHTESTTPVNAGHLVYGASARGLEWAQYMDDWVRKMERLGELNYPEEVRRQGLSGGPTLSVVINADGSLQSLRIQKRSGNPILDSAAENIVRSSAPFAPFPPPLARQARSLEFHRKWSFSSDNDVFIQ